MENGEDVPEWLKNGDYEFEYNIIRSEEHTSELQSRFDLVCRLLLEKKNKQKKKKKNVKNTIT